MKTPAADHSPMGTVYLVDDDASFLAAVARLLRAGGYAVRTFASSAEFLKHPQDGTPGCVVLDLRMPGIGGMDVQAALAAQDDSCPVIFLTGHGDIPTSVAAIRQGAVDFLTKPVAKDTLFAAVSRAIERDTVARKARARRRARQSRYDSLTPREREVMSHVVSGQLNKQIAADLGTSERTIKAHRAAIMDKLAVRSVADLVRLAGDLGVSPPAGK